MNSTFIRQDEQLLSKHFAVKPFLFHPGKGMRMAKSQLLLFSWLVKNILHCDAIVIWFADYHAVLPVLFAKIFQKKAIVLLGGMDAVKLPEVKQGVYLKPFRGFCAKFAVRFCDLVIVPDYSLIEFENTYASEKPIKAGVKNLVPHFCTKFEVIPFGFDSQKWRPGGKRESNLVLTVGFASQIHKLKLKGMDLLAEAARQIPDANFLFIGVDGEGERYLKKDKPSNLSLLAKLSNDDLVGYYQKAKVYAQFSLSEGLPNVLCEAMLCGCIPVGSNVNGIPTAIANTGFIIKERKVENAVAALKKALAANEDFGQKARARMKRYFSIESREKKLIQAIENLF